MTKPKGQTVRKRRDDARPFEPRPYEDQIGTKPVRPATHQKRIGGIYPVDLLPRGHNFYYIEGKKRFPCEVIGCVNEKSPWTRNDGLKDHMISGVSGHLHHMLRDNGDGTFSNFGVTSEKNVRLPPLPMAPGFKKLDENRRPGPAGYTSTIYKQLHSGNGAASKPPNVGLPQVSDGDGEHDEYNHIDAPSSGATSVGSPAASHSQSAINKPAEQAFERNKSPAPSTLVDAFPINSTIPSSPPSEPLFNNDDNADVEDFYSNIASPVLPPPLYVEEIPPFPSHALAGDENAPAKPCLDAKIAFITGLIAPADLRSDVENSLLAFQTKHAPIPLENYGGMIVVDDMELGEPLDAEAERMDIDEVMEDDAEYAAFVADVCDFDQLDINSA